MSNSVGITGKYLSILFRVTFDLLKQNRGTSSFSVAVKSVYFVSIKMISYENLKLYQNLLDVLAKVMQNAYGSSESIHALFISQKRTIYTVAGAHRWYLFMQKDDQRIFSSKSVVHVTSG